VRESVDLIRAAGATPCAVLIALDRMERSGKDDALSAGSAVQEVSQAYGIPVISISNLDDLLSYLARADVSDSLTPYQQPIAAYRQRYGIR
jgi:orotate phosphoribosyltransferase